MGFNRKFLEPKLSKAKKKKKFIIVNYRERVNNDFKKDYKIIENSHIFF